MKYAEMKLDFFVNVFKLIANSTFGKFCQSPLNYTYADLCLSSDDFKIALVHQDF